VRTLQRLIKDERGGAVEYAAILAGTVAAFVVVFAGTTELVSWLWNEVVVAGLTDTTAPVLRP